MLLQLNCDVNQRNFAELGITLSVTLNGSLRRFSQMKKRKRQVEGLILLYLILLMLRLRRY